MTEDIAAYVGVDWASATHYVYVLDAQGAKLGHRSFQHSGDGLAELVNWIRQTTAAEPNRIAVGIEVPHGPVVESLMDRIPCSRFESKAARSIQRSLHDGGRRG